MQNFVRHAPCGLCLNIFSLSSGQWCYQIVLQVFLKKSVVLHSLLGPKGVFMGVPGFKSFLSIPWSAVCSCMYHLVYCSLAHKHSGAICLGLVSHWSILSNSWSANFYRCSWSLCLLLYFQSYFIASLP